MKRKTSLNLVLASIAVAIALITAAAFWFYHSPYGPTIPLIRTDSSQSITQPDRPSPKIVQSARNQIGKTLRYDSAYTKLKYPMGDVPMKKGVCTDVIIRALRDQNMDLQELVHQDMSRNFSAYPNRWGLKQPDANIDHRRVPNLITYSRLNLNQDKTTKPQTVQIVRQGEATPYWFKVNPLYFTRQGWAVQDTNYQAGDIVTWELKGNRPHIGIVSDRKIGDRPLIIHNIGLGTREDDILYRYTITGHFRLPVQ